MSSSSGGTYRASSSHAHKDAAHKSRQHSSGTAGPSSSSSSVKLTTITDTLLASFYPERAFGEPYVAADSSVTSLCFDDRGDTLISAGNDEKMQIFSMSSGRQSKTHYSKKYGVDFVRFTHRSSAILHASTKVDHAIRHHSLHDNKYLRYFQGHTSRVSALQMSPVDDTFLSAAVNESVRMWDLRAANAQACMVLNGHAVVAYDPSGTVFALAFNENDVVLLYDLRRWSEKPFKTIKVSLDRAATPDEPCPVITSLTFSPTGAMLLVGTSAGAHFVVHAMDGTMLFRLDGRSPLTMQGLRGTAEQEEQQPSAVREAGVSGQECGWAPDGARVYSGAGQNEIVFWTLPTSSPAIDAAAVQSILTPSIRLTSHPGRALRTVVFNPRSAMMASAGDQIALWLPAPSHDE